MSKNKKDNLSRIVILGGVVVTGYLAWKNGFFDLINKKDALLLVDDPDPIQLPTGNTDEEVFGKSAWTYALLEDEGYMNQLHQTYAGNWQKQLGSDAISRYVDHGNPHEYVIKRLEKDIRKAEIAIKSTKKWVDIIYTSAQETGVPFADLLRRNALYVAINKKKKEWMAKWGVKQGSNTNPPVPAQSRGGMVGVSM